MRADGSAGVTADVQAGAEVPALTWIAVGLVVGGGILAAAGGLLVGLAVHRAQSPPSGEVPAHGGPTPTGPAGTEPVLSSGPTR